MTNDLFVKIAICLGFLLWSIITVTLVPLINSKVDSNELEKLYSYITVAVRCAEQIYTPTQWSEKKEYVIQNALRFMNETLHLTLSVQDVDLIIEGIVNEIKK